MSSYSVNILPLCIESEKDALLQRCLEGLSMATGIDQYYGHKRAFDVEMSDRQIIISGGQLHIKGHSISIVTEDYPRYESQKEEWLKKFNLLVLYCDARSLQEYRDRLAIIRNTMHSRNRGSDVLLFLANVDDVMNIVSMPTEQQTLMGIYSALSPMPFCATALKEAFRNCTLDSSYWHDQQFSLCHNNVQNCCFQIPRGVICDCSLHSGFCDLFVTVLRNCLQKNNIKINKPLGTHIILNINTSKNNNTMLFNSRIIQQVVDKRREKKTIRLAVIGDTASGKTFFLQDFCQTLSLLGFDYIRSNIFPFASHEHFKRDIHDVGYGKTPVYACDQRNHYVAEYSKDRNRVRIEFLDIPGEIFQRDNGNPKIMTTCGFVIETLNRWNSCKDKNFYVTYWHRGEEVIKTLAYGKGSSTNTQTATQSSLTGPQSSHTPVRGVRNADYITPISDYYNELKKEGYEEDKGGPQRINGKELLNDFFSYDAHSVYNVMIGLYPRFRRDLGGATKGEYETYMKYFYFFVFLYHSTDVVLCQRCSSSSLEDGTNDGGVPLNNIVDCLRTLYRNQDRRTPSYYLAFKGGDTFLDQTVMTDFYNNKIDLNILYSYFTAELNDWVFGTVVNNGVFDAKHPYCSPNNRRNGGAVINPSRSIIDKSKMNVVFKNLITNCVGDFKRLTQSNSVIECITPHTYFCATPIDIYFNIDEFGNAKENDKESVKGMIIKGNSISPSRRVCFGTLQLVMDIFENRQGNKYFLYGNYAEPGTILRYLQGKL